MVDKIKEAGKLENLVMINSIHKTLNTMISEIYSS
jgi:hypothetical protein